MKFEKFTPFNLKAKKEKDKTYLWCPIRKKWLIFTPEEWVRQQWISFFLYQNYPTGWIISEYTVTYQNKKKIRLDLALLDENQKMVLLAEFKKIDYQITSLDLEQLLRYASLLNPEYLLLSNYKQVFLWKQNSKSWSYYEN